MRHLEDTGKVKIGLAYIPRQRIEVSADAEAIQRALLAKPKTTTRARLARLARVFFKGYGN